MPRKPPAEPIDHHYDIPKLNRVFLAVGVVMTVVFVWMVWADYKRDWKFFQKTFLRLDRDMTREAAPSAREKAYGEAHRQPPAQPLCRPQAVNAAFTAH